MTDNKHTSFRLKLWTGIAALAAIVVPVLLTYAQSTSTMYTDGANFGIGTTGPTQKLQVVGTVAATAFSGDGSALTNVANSSGWTDGGTNVYTSTTTDNVGIGTTTPTAALLVQNAGTQASFRVNDSVLDSSPFIINAAGNVGIGTITTAVVPLEVQGNIADTSLIRLRNNATGGLAAIEMFDSDSAFAGVVGYAGPAGAYPDLMSIITNTADITFVTGDNYVTPGTRRVTITNAAGNVGIGTVAPSNKLSVIGNIGIGTTTPYRRIAGPSNGMAIEGNVGIGTWAAASGKLIVMGGNVGIGTTRPVGALTVMNGNVGIGTWSPTQRLQVVGTVDATAFSGDGSSLTGVATTIDGLTDAYTDYTTLNNFIMGRASAAALTAGAQYNVFIGEGAGATTGNSTSATDSNAVLGYNAMFSLTSGAENTAMGRNALYFNTTGGTNTAMGAYALLQNTTGTRNTAMGYSALENNKAKQESTAVGYSAMLYADDTTTAAVTSNTAVGAYALQGSTTAANNTGLRNTAVGHSALIANTTGSSNTAMGDLALSGNTTGDNNTAIGHFALKVATQTDNTAVGANALDNTTTGADNTAVGSGALSANVTGRYNTAMGYQAMFANVDKQESTAIGYWAMRYADSGASAVTANTAVGAYALAGSATPANNTGTSNNAFGHSALSGNTDGVQNVAIGQQALLANTTGDQNTAIGHQALLTNITGGQNTALGAYALYTTTTDGSTAVGYTALTSATSGVNVAVGSNAGEFVLSGHLNTAMGYSAMRGVTGNRLTGNNNTAIGTNALYILQGTAANNTALGFQAGDSITTGAANILIGYDVDTPAATTSNHLNIGNSIYGDLAVGNVGIGTPLPLSKLVVNGGVGIGTTTLSSFIGTAAPIGGLIVEKNVGIGTTSPVGALAVMNGNVGIGTTVPSSSLDVVTSSNAYPRGISSSQFSSDVYGAGVNFRKARGTATSPTTVVNGDWAGALVPTLYDGSSWLYTGYAGFQINGTVSAGSIPTDWVIYTSSSTGGGTEKFRITSTGNVGIGTSAPVGGLTVMNGNVGIGTWSPTSILQVVGTVEATAFSGDGSALTGISAGGWTDGGTNVYTSTTTDNVGIGTTTPTAALLVENAGTQESFQINDQVLDGSPFIIFADGNVGIGTTTATRKVSLVASSASASMSVRNTDTTGWSSILFSDSSSTIVGGVGYGNASASIYPGMFYIEATAKDIGFFTAAGTEERMRIVDSSGNIGIGTSTPASKLTLAGNMSLGTTLPYRTIAAPTDGMTVEGNVGIGTWRPVYPLHISKIGTAGGDTTFLALTDTRQAADANIVAGDGVTLRFSNVNNTNRMASIHALAETTASAASALTFQTNPSSGATEKMRITSVGNVGIGTTSPVGALTVMNGNVGIGTWSPTSRLQVVGTVAATAFSGDGSGLTGISAGGWTDGGTNVYASTTTDNVGVGTTTPTAALLVENAGTQDSFRVNDSVVDGSPFIIDAAGAVGIGTSDPSSPLHINSTSSVVYLTIDNRNGGATNGALIDFEKNGATRWQVGVDINAAGTNELFMYDNSSGRKPFQITESGDVRLGGTDSYSNTQAMTILQAGNVGIGTFNPVNKLSVMGNIGIGTTTPYRFIAGPNNGMAIEGNVGIGTWAANGKLIVMGGNVGIGTTKPEQNFHVRNDQDAGTGILAHNQTNSANALASLDVASGTSEGVFIAFPANHTLYGTQFADRVALLANNAAGYVSAGLDIGAIDTTADIRFYTGGSAVSNERLRILSDGNVGIGTLDPINKLSVIGNIGIGTTLPYRRIAASNNGMVVEGNVGIGTWAASNGKLIVMGGNVGIGTAFPTAPLRISTSSSNPILLQNTAGSFVEIGFQNSTVGTNTGYMGYAPSGVGSWPNNFYIVADSANTGVVLATSATERMRVNSTGNVGIGTMTPFSRLVVNGGVGIGTSVVSTFIATAAPSGGLIVENNVGIGTTSPGSKLQVNNTITFFSEYDEGSEAGAFTINWNNGNKQKVTLTGSTSHTATFTALTGGVGNVMIKIVQGDASNTITWPGTVKWPASTAPTLTTTSGATDIVSCYYDRTNYFCTGSLAFGP